ncbi:amidohydrolase family protein [Paracraurococcus lichenis]|uniref:Amidohydrolase family protein n=1 Tax=Paracraurococcus lichenis TaxID=3064888 RepID=A0ABT9E709_9PROT|nr:amidohydrolase family protein [Paracraurococcus sp. LOR1-02]MDO9711964.1 amidohydrolase family protein [Paracraurococcus sp. LOR1-02]
MGSFLSDRELAGLAPAERAAFHSPVPTQVVSNGEFNPLPQTPAQRAVEARIGEIAEQQGRRLGLDRRAFLRTGSGMAAAFLAMNEVFGPVFEVGKAEAAEPEAAAARSAALRGQFIFDDQLHFVRDDYPFEGLTGLARYAAEHWNPAMQKDGVGLGLARYKFENFLKEVYLDSDTRIGLLSGAPFDEPKNWFLTNDQIKQAAETVNGIAGTRRLLFHSLVTPKQQGWMEEVDRVIAEVKPTSWKGYTIGDPLSPQTTRWPWRLDDEALMYPFYEKAVKAGITTICIHKGLLPQDYETSIPGGAWRYANVDDVPKAAKDWPQISFVIYHAALRAFLEDPAQELARFERDGYIRWVSDLAEIPRRHGISNVYADLGTCFAISAVSSPRFCAAMMGTLIKGLGADHVFWGTDSVWYGSPQWQIEALRRLEIPEDMQRRHGFAPLGPAEGPVKAAILGGNAARHYGLEEKHGTLDPDALDRDGIGRIKAAYLGGGSDRSLAAYGYVVPRG